MFIREDIDEMIDRVEKFSTQRRKGSALIQVKNIKSNYTPPVKPLNKWKFPEDLYEYLDSNIVRFCNTWHKRQEIHDDLIPAMWAWFGIAEHSAFVGGDVGFSEDTSWHHPIIKEWDDLDKLELREDNKWLRMVVDGLSYLKERSKGKFAVKLRGADGPMDIANALRGNDFFTDFFDYPEETCRLIEFCTRAAKWTLDHQKEAVGQFHGGTITGFDIWLPGDSIGHLSEDASTMCSPAIYNEYGLPYTTKLCCEYDNAFMHTHALGKHNIPSIASIEKISFLEISNDPNCPRAIEIYKSLAEKLSQKVVVVDLTLEEIKANIDFLKGVTTIIWFTAKDIKEAQEAVKLVRTELAV